MDKYAPSIIRSEAFSKNSIVNLFSPKFILMKFLEIKLWHGKCSNKMSEKLCLPEHHVNVDSYKHTQRKR